MRRVDREPRSLLEILTGKKQPERAEPIAVSHDGRLRRFLVEKNDVSGYAHDGTHLVVAETNKGIVAIVEKESGTIRSPERMAVAGKNGRMRFFSFRVSRSRSFNNHDYSIGPLTADGDPNTDTRKNVKYAGTSGHYFGTNIARTLLGEDVYDAPRGAIYEAKKILDQPSVAKRVSEMPVVRKLKK